MAQVNVFYEPETEALTIFWQSPRKNQIRIVTGKQIGRAHV